MNFVRTEGFMSIVKRRSLISNSAGMHRLMMRKGNFPCDKNLWLQYNDLRVKVCAICEMMKGQRGLIRYEKTQGVSKWQNNFHDDRDYFLYSNCFEALWLFEVWDLLDLWWSSSFLFHGELFTQNCSLCRGFLMILQGSADVCGCT